MSNFTWAGWEQQLLNALGFPVTPQNVSFLDSWSNAEGGGGSFNPLNTTQPEPGSSNFNSFGPGGQYHVQNFPNAQTGIKGLADTLTNGYYPDIVNALKTGNPFANITDALKTQLDTWGTGHAWLSSNPTSSPSTGGSANNSGANGAPNPFTDPLGYLKWMAGGDATNPIDAATKAFGDWPAKNWPVLLGIGLLIIAAVLITSDHQEIIQTTGKAAIAGAA